MAATLKEIEVKVLHNAIDHLCDASRDTSSGLYHAIFGDLEREPSLHQRKKVEQVVTKITAGLLKRAVKAQAAINAKSKDAE